MWERVGPGDAVRESVRVAGVSLLRARFVLPGFWWCAAIGRWRASWGVLAWCAVSIDVVGFGGAVGVAFLRLAVGYLSVCYLFVLFMSFCGVFCYVCSYSFC